MAAAVAQGGRSGVGYSDRPGSSGIREGIGARRAPSGQGFSGIEENLESWRLEP